jgi:hypothetical protein
MDATVQALGRIRTEAVYYWHADSHPAALHVGQLSSRCNAVVGKKERELNLSLIVIE